MFYFFLRTWVKWPHRHIFIGYLLLYYDSVHCWLSELPHLPLLGSGTLCTHLIHRVYCCCWSTRMQVTCTVGHHGWLCPLKMRSCLLNGLSIQSHWPIVILKIANFNFTCWLLISVGSVYEKPLMPETNKSLAFSKGSAMAVYVFLLAQVSFKSSFIIYKYGTIKWIALNCAIACTYTW